MVEGLAAEDLAAGRAGGELGDLGRQRADRRSREDELGGGHGHQQLTLVGRPRPRGGGQELTSRRGRRTGPDMLAGTGAGGGHEVGIGPDGGGEAVAQRLVSGGDGDRGGVQGGAARGREIPQDRGAHQPVRERHHGAGRAGAELDEAAGRQLVERSHRVRASRDAGHVRHGCRRPEHRQGGDEVTRRVVAAGDLCDHQRSVRVGRRQRGRRLRGLDGQLVEQRPDVQWAAAGVGVETGRHPRRDGPSVPALGQLGHRRDLERPDVDASVEGVHEAHQSRGQAVAALGPAGQAEQDAVVVQPPGGEREGPQRRLVGPLRVVHHHGDRRLEVEPVDQAQEGGADRHGVGAGARREPGARVGVDRRPAQELVDDAVLELRLGLVAGRDDHRRPVGLPRGCEHVPPEGGLADAGRADEEHDAGVAGARAGQRTLEVRYLGVPPDDPGVACAHRPPLPVQSRTVAGRRASPLSVVVGRW